ncbi:hypothetical protein BC835DRAFT_1414511 [Cytidiella melzeri]|nr:hypothetical protein BC835DRAFT_1414511 [Cytidiella melzeri]
MHFTIIALALLATRGFTVSTPIPSRVVSWAVPSTVVDDSGALSAMGMPPPSLYGGKTHAPTTHRKRVPPAQEVKEVAKAASSSPSTWAKFGTVSQGVLTTVMVWPAIKWAWGKLGPSSDAAGSSSHGSDESGGSESGNNSHESGESGSSSHGSGGSGGGGSGSIGSGSVDRRDESTESLANLILAIHSRADSKDQIDPLVKMFARFIESEVF